MKSKKKLIKIFGFCTSEPDSEDIQCRFKNKKFNFLVRILLVSNLDTKGI